MRFLCFSQRKSLFVFQEKTDTLEHELRREVEDLKLRLHMAADHYKEKFKECQRLQKQINKLSDQSVSVTHCSKIIPSSIFLFENQTYNIIPFEYNFSLLDVTLLAQYCCDTFFKKLVIFICWRNRMFSCNIQSVKGCV